MSTVSPKEKNSNFFTMIKDLVSIQSSNCLKKLFKKITKKLFWFVWIRIQIKCTRWDWFIASFKLLLSPSSLPVCLCFCLSLLAVIYFKKGVRGGRGFVLRFPRVWVLLIVFSCWCFSMELCFSVFSVNWYLDLEAWSDSGTIYLLRLPNGWWYGLPLGDIQCLVVSLCDVSGCGKSMHSIRDCKMAMS